MIKKIKAKENIEELMSIWLKTNISAHNYISKEYWESNYDAVKNLLPDAEIYAFKEENVIKGFIGIANESYVAGLFVEDKYQSKGIGKKLLENVKKIYIKLELDVYKKNERAVLFYEKNGFQISNSQTEENTKEIEYHMIWEEI